MPSCKFWIDQPDGFHSNCDHPEAHGEPCVLNTEDECVIREPSMSSMQISKDSLERLRAFGYPAEKALIKVLDLVESK